MQDLEVGRIQTAGWAFDGQGSALASDGDTLVIGAPFGRSAAIDGSVTVHARDPLSPNGWREAQRLQAPGYGTIDRFGDALDVDGDVLAVGAWREGDTRGAVYVFERLDADHPFAPVARLEPPVLRPGQRFGYSLDLEGERLLVGAPRGAPPPDYAWFGRAYVYERDAVSGLWLQTADLALPTLPFTPQAHFGYRVSLSGDLALVTTYYLGFGIAMEVDVFRLQQGTWEHRQRLSERDVGGLGFQSFFGIAIALRENELYVMDPDRNQVHVFARTPAGPAEFAWTSSIRTVGGQVLAVDDDRLAIGLPFRRMGVQLYERSGDKWSPGLQLVGSSPTGSSGFGHALLLDGERVLVGDPELSGPVQPEVGGVRLFDVPHLPGLVHAR